MLIGGMCTIAHAAARTRLKVVAQGTLTLGMTQQSGGVPFVVVGDTATMSVTRTVDGKVDVEERICGDADDQRRGSRHPGQA